MTATHFWQMAVRNPAGEVLDNKIFFTKNGAVVAAERWIKFHAQNLDMKLDRRDNKAGDIIRINSPAGHYADIYQYTEGEDITL